MFIGHVALGFAAKKITPRVSLAMLLVAAQWADTLWPFLLGLGLEQVRIDPGNTVLTPLDFVSYPYSHSLLALVLWGVAIGMVYRIIAGGRRTFWVLSALVISHWLLDFITHRPDMPIYPGGPSFGLGLWNSPLATIGIELVMYAVGTWIYMTTTRPRDTVGRWAFPSLAAFLLIVYFANIAGGPPPSVTVLWIAGMAGAASLTLWAWWADRHRDPA